MRIKPGSPGGFTLVEMLVVIALIGTLMALLIPAVQMARERGRMTTCLNNIKQLGMAVLQYESSKRQFPGQAVYAAPSNFGEPAQQSWSFAILPWIGRRDYFDAYLEDVTKKRLPPDPPYLEVMVCPSDGQATTLIGSGAIPMSYAGNGGRTDVVNPPAPLDHKENGLFHNHVVEKKESLRPTSVSLSYVSKYDGAQNTLLLAEKLASDHASNALQKDYNGVSRWMLAYDKKEQDFDQILTEGNNVLVWYRIPQDPTLTVDLAAPDIGTGNPVPQTISDSGENLDRVYMRPSSGHSGGFHVAFAGGQARFMNSDISYMLYAQLMTARGRNAREPGEGDASSNRTIALGAQYEWVGVPLDEADLQ